MKFDRRLALQRFYSLVDLIAMGISFDLAAGIVAAGGNWWSLAEVFAVRLKVANFLTFLVLIIAWSSIFGWFGLYRNRRLSSGVAEGIEILKATSTGSLVFLAAGFMLNIELVTAPFVLVFWVASTMITIACRLVLRVVLERLRVQGRNLRYVLVAGTNRRAREFAERIQTRPELGYIFLGFVDEPWEGLEQCVQSGGKLFCTIDELSEKLRGSIVDEVFMSLPGSMYRSGEQIVSVCEDHGIKVRLLANMFDLRHARQEIEMFEGEPVITLRSGAMTGGAAIAKRALDIAVSFTLLLLLTPLFLITALAIKLTSPGPILFVQERIGLYKRRIQVPKFRTMVTDAEEKLKQLEHLNEVEGPVFKIKDDPRITPIGKFLRKTSIDELPQLLSVLMGDMSLVGPRPLPVRDYQGFNQDWHRRRLSVRPGLTCLWQVSGRSDIPFDKWMEMDLEYIDEWSMWLDLRILAQTIPAVLRGQGAA